MIAFRRAETEGDYEAWARIKTIVVPSEPTSVDDLRRLDGEPGRLLVLADVDGKAVACGVAGGSAFGGRAFIAARVLPAHRRQGVGTALVGVLVEHARTLGVSGVNAFVDAADEAALAFARRYGLDEVDSQLEQARVVGDEPAPTPPAGVTLVALGDRRDELLHAAWPIAREGYADMPTPQPMEVRLEEWLRDEATLPDGSFVAYAGGQLVGYAGLMNRSEEGTASSSGVRASATSARLSEWA